MRRRRGRTRKGGQRHRSGDLKRQAETPRTVAAGMPHRRGLGERATDQRAETELGRLVLRGTLSADQGLAGETYLGLWRGYVWTLAGPRELANGDGHGFTCDGCETDERRQYCRCNFRRRVYTEAYGVLRRECGFAASVAVTGVVIHDLPLPAHATEAIDLLRLGLSALARHFGLTPRQKVILGNAASQIASPGP